MIKKLVILIVGLFTILSCGKKEEEVKGNKPLIVAQGADARTLDPQKAIDTPTVRVYNQIYDGLVKKDNDMNIVPGLAGSWNKVDERRTIFNLRKGVKFHNGETLTAKDVKFTLDRMKNQPTVSFLISEIELINVIDDYTVEIVTKNGFGPLLSHLSHPGAVILNEKAVTNSSERYDQNPVGTGPYILDKWLAGDRIFLKANPEYYLGKSAIENIVIKAIPEGTNRTIALETGEADIVYDVDPVDIDKIKSNNDLKFLYEQSLGNSYLGLNTQHKPFDDVRVRQAIAYAINVDDIIEVVYKNTAIPGSSPISPKIPGYNKDVKNYEYNVEKAKKLLAEAGYPNGFKTSIWINDNTSRKDIATILQDQFKTIGIDAAIETLEWGAYIDRTAAGEHDMYILGWVTVTGDPDYGLYPVFHTSAHGRAGNRSFYSNATVDRLLDEARISTDQEKRMDNYREIQRIIQEEIPSITMVYNNQNVATQKYVENFVLHPTGYFNLYNVNFSK
ncbi:glutathione ABC transporter substrate-binding protein [Cetobacterium sp.]|uniref:glutathione ABC transporter substrate-binding protein n=1 Tax=Cetobacterium sp. TaxID=2071632 RepID=UPI003AF01093